MKRWKFIGKKEPLWNHNTKEVANMFKSNEVDNVVKHVIERLPHSTDAGLEAMREHWEEQLSTAVKVVSKIWEETARRDKAKGNFPP